MKNFYNDLTNTQVENENISLSTISLNNDEHIFELNLDGEIESNYGKNISKSLDSIYNLNEIIPNSIHNKIHETLIDVIKNKETVKFKFTNHCEHSIKNYSAKFYPSTNGLALLRIEEISQNIDAEKYINFSSKLINTIWNSSKEGICIINKDGEIVAINNSGSEILNIAQTELQGKVITEIIKNNSISNKCKYLKKGDHSSNEKCRRVIFRGNDNNIIEAKYTKLLNNRLHSFDHDSYLVSVFNKQNSEHRIKERQKLISDILKVVNGNKNFKDLVKEIITLIIDFEKIDSVFIKVQEEDGFHCISKKYAVLQSSFCNEYPSDSIDANLLNNKSNRYCGLCKKIMLKKAEEVGIKLTEYGSFWTNNASEIFKYEIDDEILDSSASCCINKNYESIALIPLSLDEENIGLIQMYDHRKGVFNKETITFYEILSQSLILAIKMKYANNQLLEQNSQILEKQKFLSGIYSFRKVLNDSENTEENIYLKLLEILEKIVDNNDLSNIKIKVYDKVYSKNYSMVFTHKITQEIWNEQILIGEILIYSHSVFKEYYLEELKYFLDAISTELGAYYKHLITKQAKIYKDICFDTVWQNSNDGKRLSNNKGIIIQVNHAYCRLVGKEAAELVGRPIREIYKDEIDFEACELDYKTKKLADILQVKSRYETKVTFCTDKTCYLDITYSLINNELLLGIFRDDTSKVLAKKEFLEREKLATIGRFTSYLTHEIKSYLNPMKMSVELLSRSSSLRENDSRHVMLVKNQFEYLEKLIKKVLNFTRKNDLHVSNLNLFMMVENLKQFLNFKLEKQSINLYNLIPQSIEILADFEKIQSTFLHLLENSIDSINNTGLIEIRSAISKENDTFSIFIKDSGEGINNPERIFNPFYSTKKYGTGLGLSVVNNHLKLHDGELKLLSAEKGNTIFELIFPIWRIKYGDHTSN